MFLKKSLSALVTVSLISCGFVYAQQQHPDQQRHQQAPQQEHYQGEDRPPQQQQPAPVEVSESDLEQFVEAVGKVDEVQQENQQKMMSVIEKHEMTVDEFNQIMQAQQAPGGEAPDVSQEQLEKFNQASGEIQQIQANMDTEVQQAIGEAGMDMEEYQNIYMAIQQDPELMQRVQEMMEHN
jgi:TolA-binding protein